MRQFNKHTSEKPLPICQPYITFDTLEESFCLLPVNPPPPPPGMYVSLFPSQPPSSLNLRLDDALFQRLVESRWDAERGATASSDQNDNGGNGNGGNGNGGDGHGVDFDGFARIYRGAATPATAFGRHLRKAAGRGEEELGKMDGQGYGVGELLLYVCSCSFDSIVGCK